mgnify:CR=1 FL=1
MENKYKVRIMRSEIRNIKNVAYGDVMYMNYGSINKKAMCDKTDIVGIYGQNGSGKTALVESLDMLRQILTGSPINYEMYEGICQKTVLAVSVRNSLFGLEKKNIRWFIKLLYRWTRKKRQFRFIWRNYGIGSEGRPGKRNGIFLFVILIMEIRMF